MAKKKKNAGSDMSGSLITLGILAVGGYFVYEMFFANPATPATTSTTPTTPSTTATTTPPASSGTTTTPPATTPSTSTGSTTPQGSALNTIYQQMLALIAQYQDTNFTNLSGASSMAGTPYHFNVYLAMAAPGDTIPDPAVVFGSEAAASQTITAASYWADMGPALASANPGLSGGGLGMFAGAGAYMRGLGAFRW